MSIVPLPLPPGAEARVLLHKDRLHAPLVVPRSPRLLDRLVDVTQRPTDAIARLGLARTFQSIRLFPDLSVIEDVMAGLHMRYGKGVLTTLLGLPRFGRAEATIGRRAQEISSSPACRTRCSSRRPIKAHRDRIQNFY